MRYFLQVLSTGSESFSPSFMLFFDNTRFLFNCGEGLQRYFTQHKIRLVKLHTILLTRLVWSHIGGLPGLILSAADSGSSGVQLVGPPGCTSFVKSLYPFIRRSNFPVSIVDDEAFKVLDIPPLNIETFYLLLHDSIPKIPQINVKSQGMFKEKDSPPSGPIKRVHVKDFKCYHEHPNEQEEENDSVSINENFETEAPMDKQKLGDIVSCYLIRCPDKPGKFHVDKAAKLGIFGPNRGLLTKGIPVTLEGGRTIQPADVISPKEPGKRIFIIEIPSESYLKDKKALFHNSCEEEEQKLFENIDLMLHILGEGVESSSMYISWFNSIAWKPACKHIIFFTGSHEKPALFPSSELLTLFLRKKCGANYYPLLSSTLARDTRPLMANLASLTDFSILQAVPLMRIFLEPEFVVHHQDPSSIMGKILEENLHENLDENLDEKVSGHTGDSIEEPSYPAFVFLGTGSAIPSKYRNVSSILYQISESSSMLLDCGEGTLGQLSRVFCNTPSKVLSTISVIFISHLHADHHLGVAGILSAIHRNNPNQKVSIVAPILLGSWLSTYRRYFEDLVNVTFIPSRSLLNSVSGIEVVSNEIYIETCPLKHIPSSYGAIIHSKSSGVSIAYSGDTRPCEFFSRIVKERNVSILIHEATFEDDLEAQAISKAHSTWSEAISIAKQANVRYLILTHFSQRYPVASPPSVATSYSFAKDRKLTAVYAIFDLLRLPIDKIDQYYDEYQISGLLSNVEAEFQLLKASIGSDSDIDDEIKYA